MLNAIESNSLSPPCLILAHANAAYAVLIAHGFRGLGWDVYLARDGPEARRLARIRKPEVVILEAELPAETGWLTCDKLTREQPLARVILVSDNLSPRNQDLATFDGSDALIDCTGGMASLIDELENHFVTGASYVNACFHGPIETPSEGDPYVQCRPWPAHRNPSRRR